MSAKRYGPLKTLVYALIVVLGFFAPAGGAACASSCPCRAARTGTAPLPPGRPARGLPAAPTRPLAITPCGPASTGTASASTPLVSGGRKRPRPRPRARWRIVAVGDSPPPFGLSRAPCTYPAALARRLELTAPSPVEVINAGVEGYDSRRVATFHAQPRARGSRRDLVLVYLGWNDLYSPHALPSDGGPHPARPEMRGCVLDVLTHGLDHLYTYRMVRRLLFLELPRLRGRMDEQRFDRPVEVPAFLTDGFARDLRRIVKLVHEAGAVPVLLTLPHAITPDDPGACLGVAHYPRWGPGDLVLLHRTILAFNDIIRRTGADTGSPVIDAAAWADAMGPTKVDLFFDTLHMKCRGYAMLGDMVGDELLRQGLAPGRADTGTGTETAP